MDFSSNINTLLDPFASVSNLKIISPRNSMGMSNRPKSINLVSRKNSPTRSIQEQCPGLDIFHLNRPKQEKIVPSVQGPLYSHVYRNELLIDEVLNYFKAHKKPESPKTATKKFMETGKFFKIKRSDFKACRMENDRIDRKWVEERKARCQTATITTENCESPRHSPRWKDIKAVKRELIPQTKARSPSKCIFQLDSLSIKGTNKDFTIRKFQNSHCNGQRLKDNKTQRPNNDFHI